MAVFRPPLEDCSQLVEPLNPGERRVADTLVRLDDSWTVYIQPRIAHDIPDFIAVHDRHGVCAIEVKDWARGKYRQADCGSIEFTDGRGGWSRSTQQPRYQAFRYRSTLFDQFFALPDDVPGPSQQVRAAVILPNYANADAARLLDRVQVTRDEQRVEVWGGDGLEASLERIVRGAGCQPPSALALKRLRRQLVESEVVTDVRRGPKMSTDAQNIEKNPNAARIRRVRGPAGCGKSFGLAARAARLAADRKRVLVLSFNSTLSNYLRTLVSARCQEYGANPTLVTCVHFHAFCQRVVQDAECLSIRMDADPQTEWFDRVVHQAQQALAAGMLEPYDAVLIDEGQDFTLDWWNMLRHHVVRPDGEMLLVADPTQDVYGKQAWTDEERMLGSGFAGPWTELRGSYRMPSDVVPLANAFAKRYLGGDRLSGEVPADHLDIAGLSRATLRHWENVRAARDLGAAIGHEVVRLLDTYDELSPNDVVFLCEHHTDGLDAVQVIEQAGHPVHHIFAKRGKDRTRRKLRFWPDAPGVKGCTVHSFKGWETPALVMGIGRDLDSRRLAYVAMTRIKVGGSDRGAYLSVVNSDLTIAGFQSTFEEWAPPRAEMRVLREETNSF